MPIKSKWPPLKIADCSIANLVFTSPTHPLPNKPAFIDAENPGHFLTLQTFRLWSQRLAAGLRKHGFQPDDRLLLFSGNNIYFPVVLFGTIMAGGIFTGANPSYVARELAYQLKNSDAKFLLCSSASLDVGLDAASQIGMPKSSIFVFDDKAAPSPAQSGCKHWSALLASESEGRRFEWNPCTKPGESDKTIVLNYSSGTTGVPKGVEITHKNYVSNCSQQAFMFDNKENSEEDLKTEVGLCFLPMYHAMAQTYYSVMYPLRGIPVYIMPKFDFEKMLGAIQKYKVTALMVVPPIIVALAKHPAVRKWTWDLSSIRSIGCGAAPLGPDISKEFESLWKGKPQQDTINVKQGWGMTEATCTVLTFDPNDRSTSNSVGQLVPNCTARIMNEDGTSEVAQGDRGELWIKAPNVMKGYWRNPEATRETLTPDGWLKTGDIALVDDKGHFYIVDRKKELIKVKGNQVAPAELESLLLGHPAVVDAAVIGVPLDHDEAPRAYVVLVPGGKVNPSQETADNIAKFVAERVTKTKRLTGGVRFIDAIPKNPSGKILRKGLREIAKKEDTRRSKL